MPHLDPYACAFPSPRHRLALLEELRSSFAIDWHGVHGVAHWARVWNNGRRLAVLEGNARIDLGVVELFAWMHDSCRRNDDHDPDHGPRAAALARELRGGFFELSDARLELLGRACEGHTRGGVEACPTVLTCWDADRLDLGRVGIEPDPRRLGTASARRPEVIAWALARSRRFDGEEALEWAGVDAEPRVVADEASYPCDSCGETVVIPIDESAGREQEFVEDCPVCRNPNVIRVRLEAGSAPTVRARSES